MLFSRYLCIALTSFSFYLTSCTNKSTLRSDEQPVVIPDKIFYGKAEFVTSVETDDSTYYDVLSQYAPDRIEIWFADTAVRIIEHGGLSHGNVIIYPAQKEAWQLDTATQLAYFGEISDMDLASDIVREQMPDHFAPTLAPTGNKKNILGHPCTEFLVKRSGFIPATDSALVWLADDFVFPPSRFDIQTDVNQVIVPIPLYLGVQGGAVMRLDVHSKNYTRSIYVSSLSEGDLPEHIFSIPDGFQKK
ncbi:MAG: hypothetical protein R2794_04565 [Chitinophagales bacterium]